MDALKLEVPCERAVSGEGLEKKLRGKPDFVLEAHYCRGQHKRPGAMKLLSRLKDLPPALAASVTVEESAFVETLQSRGILPFAVTPFYAGLVCEAGETDDASAEIIRRDIIRKQFFPSPEEARILPYELEDPLGEAHFRVAPRLVHQYHDRVLLLANGTCAGYCRHCFRRSWTSTLQGFITEEELEPVKAYLSSHPEVREVLVSGGDPLMGSDARLEMLFQALRTARPGVLLRIGSRMPVMAPERITADLVALFRKYRPLRLILHINHSKELAPQVRSAIQCLIEGGIPVHTQTVLLGGVNDSAPVLADLFRKLLDLGATPYYLFQGDLAPGTSHFRVNLERGLIIYQELTKLISGLGLPAFAVDLPGGGGKVHLHPGCIEGEEQDTSGQTWYLLRSRDNTLWRYPKEH